MPPTRWLRPVKDLPWSRRPVSAEEFARRLEELSPRPLPEPRDLTPEEEGEDSICYYDEEQP